MSEAAGDERAEDDLLSLLPEEELLSLLRSGSQALVLEILRESRDEPS